MIRYAPLRILLGVAFAGVIVLLSQLSPQSAPFLARFGILRRDSWTFIAPALVCLFYWIAWLRIGPEPEAGPVVARYEPPPGISAAAARYITTGTTDGRSFAAVIAALAVGRCIRVEPVGGKYRVSRLMHGRAEVAALSAEEKELLRTLFEDAPVIELSPALNERNTAQNSRYVARIHRALHKQMGETYFARHAGVIALGVMVTFAVALVFAAIAGGRQALEALFFTVWILFAGLVLGLIFQISFVPAWKTALRSGVGRFKMLPAMGAVVVLAGVMGFLLVRLAESVSVSFAMMVAALLAANLAWGPMLKRRTPLGRQVANEIAGFRQFLETVEQDHLNRLNTAEQTPELDQFLPFAIALEVQEAWGDHLAQAFFASTVMVE